MATTQLSEAVRNARLNAIETTIGTSAVLKIFDGTLPANCAAADNGTALAVMSLDSNWMADAASGAKAKAGTWADTSADAGGTADYYRIYASNGTTCGMQGDVTATGGGGSLTLDTITIASAQAVTITSFTITDGNA